MKNLCAKIFFIFMSWKKKMSLSELAAHAWPSPAITCLPPPLQNLCKVLDRFPPYFTDYLQLVRSFGQQLVLSSHFLVIVLTSCFNSTNEITFYCCQCGNRFVCFHRKKTIYFKFPQRVFCWMLFTHTQNLKNTYISTARVTRILTGWNFCKIYV